MEQVKLDLKLAKENYDSDIKKIMSKLDEVKNNPLLIMTELYDTIKHSKVENQFVFTTEKQNNTYAPLLETLDIFKGYKLKSNSTYTLTVSDMEQQLGLCTFDICQYHYFGTLKEPHNYNEDMSDGVPTEMIKCVDKYINNPSFINKYKVFDSDSKTKNFFKILGVSITFNNDKLMKACLKIQREEKYRDELIQQQQNEYEESMEKYLRNKDKASELYQWLDSIGYHKA